MSSARLLALLALFSGKSHWTGTELAERLKVSPRTLRYDIGKLRDLGYPVLAVPGVAGGYRLGAGARLPPLLLDDEEAVAVATSLRAAAGGTVTGIEETAVRALAKLDQVLPDRLRRQVRAVHEHTEMLPRRTTAVDADVLVALTAACRDRRRVRFDYRGEIRDAEPYRLVNTGRHWYLVAWDVRRDDWRTFRVDRLALRTPGGPRFAPRADPPADLVPRSVHAAQTPVRTRATVRAPAAEIAARVPATVAVEPVDDVTCVVHAGADSPFRLALHLLMLDADFTVDGPPELLDALARIGQRVAISTENAAK